ncbi:MAG: alpha/beta hydrolase [Candidatus Hydrogenedentes bacterium]|nr:alpha/beta hydrolase [Candidatus Hydrogenedentota bacterium]
MSAIAEEMRVLVRTVWQPQLLALFALCLSAGLVTGCAQFVEGPDVLDFPGPYVAKSYYDAFPSVSGEVLQVTVYYPDAPPPPEGWPLIVMSSGWNQARTSYDAFATQLTEWGYVVVIRFYPSLGYFDWGLELFDEHIIQSVELVYWCEMENGDPDSRLYGLVNAYNVGMIGHSMGGNVAIGAAAVEKRVRAVVSLDAQFDRNDFELGSDPRNLQGPVLYIGSTDGGFCSYPPDFDQRLYDYTPAPTAEVLIEGADHMDFIQDRAGNGDAGEQVCPTGRADPTEVRKIAGRYMVAWCNVHLKGLTEFETYYHGAFSERDEALGLVRIRGKWLSKSP